MLPYLSLTIISVLSAFYSFAQTGAKQPFSFELNGKLHGRDSGILILWYPDSTENYRRDTTTVQNGNFHFTGFVNEPSYVHIIGQPRTNNYASFFLEPGKQAIELTQNDFTTVRITGSPTQIQASLLKQQMDSIKANSKNISDSGLRSITIGFIYTHPSSYVSPTELLGLLNSLKIAEAEALYYSLDESIRNSRVGILCYNEILKKKKVYTGMPAPDFETTDYKNKRLALYEFKGKYVLLDFWASWCIPCRKSTPALLKAYSKYHKKGLEIIAIADDDTKEKAWRKAIKKDKIEKWIHVLNGTIKQKDGTINTANSINEKYAIEALPTKILIDKENTIIGIFQGGDEEEKMYELLEGLFRN